MPATSDRGTRKGKRVLGNDPFERGAAPRTPRQRPTAKKAKAPVRARSAEAPAAKVEASLREAEPQLSALLDGQGAVAYVGELKALFERMLPHLRERLGSLAQIRKLLRVRDDLDAHGMSPSLGHQLGPVLDFLYGAWWRVEVRGIERIPSVGGAVIVANHGGALPWDALVLRQAFLRIHPARRELRPLLDPSVFEAPLVGTILSRLGGVPASPENANDLLSDGTAIAVFPEGRLERRKPQGERYQLLRFGRGGFAKLAIRHQAPVVPCAIVGSEETSPELVRLGGLGVGPLGLLPLPAKWRLRFGEPIHTASLGAGPDAFQDLTDRTRAALQKLLDDAVADRASTFI
jgi:1-acyl-sn-glycerol-3-phosphate acyltransferase